MGRRDDAAVLRDAADLIAQNSTALSRFGAVIVYLPDEPDPLERALLGAIDEATEVTVLLGRTGHQEVDAPLQAALRWDADIKEVQAPIATRVVHASDADEEVRDVVRELRLRLAEGVPAHHIAMLYSVAAPYSRLAHDHLAGAGIAANGPGVRALRDRAVADGFLALLSLDPDDLQRIALFAWLNRAPVRRSEAGGTVPGTQWERLAREAGITGGDWAARLADHEARHRARLEADQANPDASKSSIAYRERAIAATKELNAFVGELQSHLRDGSQIEGWASLAEWAREMFRRYFAVERLPEDEQRAATAIELTLSGLAELDDVGDAASVSQLIEILDIELDSRRSRVGRFGEGVFVGPITQAPSLEVSHVFVVGLSEDQFPGRLLPDPLLPESVRASSGGALATARDHLRRSHRALLAAFQIGDDVTASFPRGDLRRGSERLPSRWLMPTLRALAGSPDLEATRWSEASSETIRSVASHWQAMTGTPHPGTEQEWRVRHLATGGRHDEDAALGTAIEMVGARRSSTFTRFDGNLSDVAGLPDFLQSGVVAPTTLERYAGCPHAYFVERLLRVSPVDTPEDILSLRPWDLGSIVHEVLDQLVRDVLTDGGLPDYGEAWRPEHRERMRAIAEEVMSGFERRGLTGHPRLWANERERLQDDFEAILDLDDQAHAEHGSRVIASELTFGMNGEPPVRIELASGAIAMKGSADRVDEREDGRLIVTDFKTGSARGFADIRSDPVAAGRKLQLPLYAAAARERFGNGRVEAAYWFIGRRDRGERIPIELTDEIDATYRSALETLVTGIRTGSFIARPPATDDFAWVQCQFCNPDGVGYGHIRRPSDQKRTDPALADLFRLLDPAALEDDEETPR